MGIVLPKEIENLAEARARAAGYRDAAEYIARLIEADVRDTSDAALETLLLEAADEPDGDDAPFDFETIRTEGRALAARHR